MTGDGAEESDADALGAADPSGSFRGLLSTAIEALKTRADLLVVEAEIYLLRTIQTLVWAFAAVACALLAFVFIVVAIIAVLWDTHRLAGVLGGAAAFIILTLIFAAIARRTLRFRPLALEKTIEQLEHDRRKVDGLE